VQHGEKVAWQLYIKRLGLGLKMACDLREGEDHPAADDQEFGQILADLFCVNSYVLPAGAQAQ